MYPVHSINKKLHKAIDTDTHIHKENHNKLSVVAFLYFKMPHSAQIWDVVEQYDTGCTPGGGKDSMNVFYDAGLLFKASNALETPDRTGKVPSLFDLSSYVSCKGHSATGVSI